MEMSVGQSRKGYANLRALSETEGYEAHQQEKRFGSRVRIAGDRERSIQPNGTRQ